MRIDIGYRTSYECATESGRRLETETTESTVYSESEMEKVLEDILDPHPHVAEKEDLAKGDSIWSDDAETMDDGRFEKLKTYLNARTGIFDLAVARFGAKKAEALEKGTFHFVVRIEIPEEAEFLEFEPDGKTRFVDATLELKVGL